MAIVEVGQHRQPAGSQDQTPAGLVGQPVQVRLHGRGGQGVVTTAEILAMAAFDEGRYAQAFPSFGSERSGAPVAAFCRIATRRIRTRAPVLHPDILVVQDATLVHQVDLFAGLAGHELVIINSSRHPHELGLQALVDRLQAGRVLTVPATEMARVHLGRPMPGAALLGALAAAHDVITIEAVARALAQRFSGAIAAGNIDAARAAFQVVASDTTQRTASAAQEVPPHASTD